MKEQRITFLSRDGLTLEGLIFENESRIRRWIILCHPHPLYGGQMKNNVVSALQQLLAQAGFSTLRFNFRGVGESEGEYADGIGEERDVQGAVDFIIEREDAPLSFVGYSFGAAVGTKAINEDKRVNSLVCISPPLEMYDFSYLKDDTRPKLFIAGDQDFVCPVKRLEEFSRSLHSPPLTQVIPGADHFWWGFEDRMAIQVVDFLRAVCCG